MIAIRLVRSKLRKRDDHHSSAGAVHPETTVVQTATSLATIGAPTTHPDGCCTQMSTTTMSTDLGNSVCDEHVFAATTVTPSANPVDPFAWQFPPPYPPPHMPPAQYALYNDQVGAHTLYVLYFILARDGSQLLFRSAGGAAIFSPKDRKDSFFRENGDAFK